MSNGRRLFRPAPLSEWRRNAAIGPSLSNDVVYAIGFKEAGDALVEACRPGRRSLGGLFYPICFCYRHYMELELKRLIVMAEELYELLEVCGAARRPGFKGSRGVTRSQLGASAQSPGGTV